MSYSCLWRSGTVPALVQVEGVGRMKAAFAVWNGRIAPVFDVARRVIIVEIFQGRVIARQQGLFECDDARHKADRLKSWGVQILVCGAVSHYYGATLAAEAVKAVAFVAGEIEEIIAAFLAEDLDKPDYRMPGCHGCCRIISTAGKAGRRRRPCRMGLED